MILRNEFVFGGEVVHTKDFGIGKGGNVTINGASKVGDVKLSVNLTEAMFQQVCDKRYPKIIVKGHLEQRTHETSGNNIKYSLRYIADNLELLA